MLRDEVRELRIGPDAVFGHEGLHLFVILWYHFHIQSCVFFVHFRFPPFQKIMIVSGILTDPNY